MEQQKNLTAENKIVFYCDKVIEYGIYALVFFVPLVFCPPIVYDVIDLPKIVVMQTITLIILFAYILKFLLQKEKIIRFPKDILFYPIVIFIIITFLSVVNSLSPLISIYGLYLINQGFLVILTYFLIYFFVANRNKEEINKMFVFMIISATLVATYGILQKLGYNPLFYGTTMSTEERSYSTLGNPIYLGGYLIMVIPIAIAFFFNSDVVLYKVSLFVSILIMYCSLIFTYSRGAYIGFLFSLFVFFYFLGPKYIIEYRRILLYLIVSFLVLFVIFSKQQITTPDGKKDLIERIISIGDIRENASAARLVLWKGTLKIIKDYPFLGTGLETFGIIYPKYQDPSYLKFEGRLVMAGKPHNIFLQTAINSGLAGIFVYLWIIVIFLRYVVEKIKKTDYINERIIYVSVLSAIVGYLVQSQFAFDTPSVGLLYWVYLGSIGGIGNINKDKKEIFIKIIRKNSPTSPIKKIFNFFSLLFIVGTFIFLILFIWKPLLADAYYRKGRFLYFNSHNRMQAIANFEKSIKLNPFTGLYTMHLASVYLEEGEYQKSKDLYLKTLNLFPNEIDVLFGLGIIYEEEKNYKDAIKIYEECKKLWEKKYPENNELYFRLANLYSQDGKYEKAIELYEKMLMVEPENREIKEIVKLLRNKVRK
jgi:O-antigen ligase